MLSAAAPRCTPTPRLPEVQQALSASDPPDWEPMLTAARLCGTTSGDAGGGVHAEVLQLKLLLQCPTRRHTPPMWPGRQTPASQTTTRTC